MGGSGAFDRRRPAAAVSFREAAARALEEDIIYLGGLGRDDDLDLSATC